MIRAFAAHAARGRLEPFMYEPAPLGAQEVEIHISHCGMCHTDLHYLDNDWGNSSYPLIPGHEIVGVISAVGTAVTQLTLRQRVGVGYQSGSCMECERCLSGQENLCERKELTCRGRPGGYADFIRVDSRFVFPLPAALASETAAPLLCAGVTVYAALQAAALRPGQHVGVLGIGGLGHIALQFARALGYEVTAFSTSPDKEADARRFGAHHFIHNQEPTRLESTHNTFDLLLSTVTARLDWSTYVNLLRPNGRLHFVGSLAGSLDVPAGLLIAGQKSLSGSLIGSRATLREMLELAAQHNIQAETEVVPITEVNVALDKVRHHEARYRMVLQM